MAPPLRQRRPLRILTDVPLLSRCSSDSSSSPPSLSDRNITPGSTPSTGIPQCLFPVLCLYDFESSDPAHLPFHKDEVLIVIKQECSGWWAAMRPHGNRTGWIPNSFVSTLDRSKVVEHQDERPLSYQSLNDPPVSVAHDLWVPVSEDCATLSFELGTPTDLVLHKSFLDDIGQNHDCVEPPFTLQDNEQSSLLEGVCVLDFPEIPSPYGITRSHSPRRLPFEPDPSQLTRPASPDAALHHNPCPSSMDDQTLLLCFATPVDSDEIAADLIHVEESHKSVAISRDDAHSHDGTNGRSQSLGLPMDFRSPDPDQSLVRGSGQLAEQLVSMHALYYATIRQHECLDWISGCSRCDVSGLQHFFDVHDYVASWVQRSILVRDDDDIAQQTETLDFWIRVAETCRSFRNFDSLSTIVSACLDPRPGLSGHNVLIRA